MEEIQITLNELKKIIDKAEANRATDNSLSEVVTIRQQVMTENPLGSDLVLVWQKSKDGKSNGKRIGYIGQGNKTT